MSFTDNFPFSVASSSSFGIKVLSHWPGWRTLVQDHGLPVHSWLQIGLDLNLEWCLKMEVMYKCVHLPLLIYPDL